MEIETQIVVGDGSQPMCGDIPIPEGFFRFFTASGRHSCRLHAPCTWCERVACGYGEGRAAVVVTLDTGVRLCTTCLRAVNPRDLCVMAGLNPGTRLCGCGATIWQAEHYAHCGDCRSARETHYVEPVPVRHRATVEEGMWRLPPRHMRSGPAIGRDPMRFGWSAYEED